MDAIDRCRYRYKWYRYLYVDKGIGIHIYVCVCVCVRIKVKVEVEIKLETEIEVKIEMITTMQKPGVKNGVIEVWLWYGEGKNADPTVVISPWVNGNRIYFT